MIAENGKIMRGKGITETNQSDILQMFRTERDNQYDEILEERQEFVDEINHNIDKKRLPKMKQKKWKKFWVA